MLVVHGDFDNAKIKSKSTSTGLVLSSRATESPMSAVGCQWALSIKISVPLSIYRIPHAPPAHGLSCRTTYVSLSPSLSFFTQNCLNTIICHFYTKFLFSSCQLPVTCHELPVSYYLVMCLFIRLCIFNSSLPMHSKIMLNVR